MDLKQDEVNRGGRPTKLTPDEKTLKIVKGLGNIQATTKECAALLCVSEPTYLKFKRDHEDVSKAYQEGAGQGLISLRRTQFRLAEKNAAMAIFLGKNYLGQTDKIEHAGPNGGPIQTMDLTKLSDDQLSQLENIFGPLAASSSDDAPDTGREGEKAG